MSVFTNPASRSIEQARAYTTAVLELLGSKDPIDVLRNTPDEVRKLAAGLTERELSQPEADGKWSIRHVVRHLADSDLVWGYRMRLVLAQDRPMLTGYDQDRWAERLRYDQAPVEEALEDFRVLRRSNLRLIVNTSSADFERVGVHAERGEESVAHMIRLYAGHDLLHLAQIARIRQAIRPEDPSDARHTGEANAASDPVLAALNEIVGTTSAVSQVKDALQRVLRQLDSSTEQMAWEIIPLTAFGRSLPESIRSCWVFGIRAGAETGAERHPNSHQRSLSLVGRGIFEIRETQGWTPYGLVSEPGRAIAQRWVTIPAATWHRLVVDHQPWGMVSFHTVAPEELIEERPLDPADPDGATRQQRYAGTG
jgi:DinB superfamily